LNECVLICTMRAYVYGYIKSFLVINTYVRTSFNLFLKISTNNECDQFDK